MLEDSNNQKSTTDTLWQAWQNPEVADRFTAAVRNGVLEPESHSEIMLRLLRQVPEERPVVLDLGCGDGSLLGVALNAFPNARGTGLDGSSPMLQKAFENLASFGDRVEAIVQGDFSAPGWQEHLPREHYDMVISAFAIHHIPDKAKKTLYAKIFEMLTPGGVFVNCEHVASSAPMVVQLFGEKYTERLLVERRSQNEDVSQEQLMQEYSARPDAAANLLAPLDIQLEWLRAIGYTNVECYWKLLELAVLAGFRSGKV